MDKGKSSELFLTSLHFFELVFNFMTNSNENPPGSWRVLMGKCSVKKDNKIKCVGKF